MSTRIVCVAQLGLLCDAHALAQTVGVVGVRDTSLPRGGRGHPAVPIIRERHDAIGGIGDVGDLVGRIIGIADRAAVSARVVTRGVQLHRVRQAQNSAILLRKVDFSNSTYAVLPVKATFDRPNFVLKAYHQGQLGFNPGLAVDR